MIYEKNIFGMRVISNQMFSPRIITFHFVKNMVSYVKRRSYIIMPENNQNIIFCLIRPKSNLKKNPQSKFNLFETEN